MAKFFINRPIVAMVVSILMVIIGIVAMSGLPIAQFPNIADPQIQVNATYPGADASTVQQSVAVPIEVPANAARDGDSLVSGVRDA